MFFLSIATGYAQRVDDFADGGWSRSSSTPGTLSVKPGELHLVDESGPPDWVTVSKVLPVSFDKTPFFVVKVATLSGRGTVKLIRRETKDKRVCFEIDEPGLYAIDMRKAYGWTGAGEVEVSLYASGDRSEITYGLVKFVAALSAEEERQVSERAALDDPKLRVAPFELVPLFNSCSYYFASPLRPSLAVEFRRSGAQDWRKAYPPVYVPEDGMYRGSVVRLEEDTPYELRVREGANGAALAQGEFRTWRSEVPVAETVVLDEKSFDGFLRVTKSGTPDGWIRYTSKPGFVLRNDRKRALIELAHVRHVILDGLTLRGGLQEAIAVQNCQHVRILNCDIAGWGRPGTQRFDLDGKYYTAGGRQINWDTGILVRRSLGTVIERCYIHDPVTTANSWYYSHPAGPQAVGIAKPRSTVMRYNDFIGSDEHRWNDATEGEGNFDPNGGFNRDADIHGNFACFANDDAIEIDGGQINVRVFDNWYEGCLCGVSIQGCMSGPSYVFDNQLVNMGDERNLAGQSIKTSSNSSGSSAVSFILGNTTFGRAHDLGLLDHLRIVARNNVFSGKSNITSREKSPRSDCDFNLELAGKPGTEAHGVVGDPGLVDPAAGHYDLRENSPARGRGEALDNFTAAPPAKVDLGAIPFGSVRILPVRPMPVQFDRNQLQFRATETSAGVAKTVVATAGKGFQGAYRIAQNEAFDWFTVTPATGTLRSGKAETFTVTVRPERMAARAIYKGAFLLRMENGLSRPVMVYAETSYKQPVKPAGEGVWTQFVEGESPVELGAYKVEDDPVASGGRCLLLAGRASGKPAEYCFTTPQAGKYFVVLRVRGDTAIRFGMDDGPLESARLRSAGDWGWSLAAQNRSMSLICLQSFDLAPGEHFVKLAPRDAVCLDLVALTDHPKIFE